MRRALLLAALAISSCFACGCAAKYAKYVKGVDKTVCEVWIYSMPQGARLYFNGHYVGRTPYKYTAINEGDSSAHFIAADLSEIVARRRGYDDEVETITIANCYKKLSLENEGTIEQVKKYKGNLTLYLDEKEVAAEKEHGNVVISTVPEGPDAEIYINDSLIGNGKTSLLKLPAGSYVLKIKKPGYKQYARIISVLADNDLTITARLEKASGEDDTVSTIVEAEEVDLSPAGEESEIDEDEIPGTLGGKE
jgi:hypothetical protein